MMCWFEVRIIILILIIIIIIDPPHLLAVLPLDPERSQLTHNTR
jgi:hypothetical protein